MRIPGEKFGPKPVRGTDQQYSNLNLEDGTGALTKGLGQVEQGVESLQARAQKVREKAIAAASDAGFAQAQEFTTNQMDGYDEAPKSKPEGSTTIDTLTVEDIETAGDPGAHVPGFLDSRGNDAYQQASATTEKLQKFYDSLVTAAPNEETRQHLSHRLDALKATVRERIAIHEGQQLKVAEQAASKSLQDSTVRTAANLYDQDDKLKPFVDDALASIKRTSLPEEFEAKKTEYLSKVSKAMIGKYIAAGDLHGAEQRLKTDEKVLGDDAPVLQEIITRKQKAAEKDAAELTSQAVMDRVATGARNSFGFVDIADENKLREAALQRYPEDKKEALAVAEQWINNEGQRRQAVIQDWTRTAKTIRLDNGTRGIPAELREKLKKYNPDYWEHITAQDKDQFEKWQKKAQGGAEAKKAAAQQRSDDKLALTRMLGLSYQERAELEQSKGFEQLVPGRVLSEQGVADLQRAARNAKTNLERGFSTDQEALMTEVKGGLSAKLLKHEPAGTLYESQALAAKAFDDFVEVNKRVPTPAERRQMVSDATVPKPTLPRSFGPFDLDPGMELPAAQVRREGPAPSKVKPGRYQVKGKPGKYFNVDANGVVTPE